MATLIIFTLLFLSNSNSAASTPLIASILGSLGFHELAAANLTVATSATIFAPTDSSLLTCPNCSASLLLQEHSVAGLYPIHFLRRLPFATKIQTLAPDRCLTVTVTASAAAKVFINGVEIAKPDFFNNGLIIVHALQGYLSPLSPNSCTVETMNTLSYTQQRPSASIMRFMLKDAMSGLRVTGYSVAALALRLRYADLLELKKMTLFAVDDVSIFVDGSRGGGQSYAVEMGFHIVPNRLLTAAELIRLPRGAKLRTMESGRSLVVTTGGDAGVLEPMRINFVRVERFDLVVNKRIAVHGVSTPFRDVDNPFSTQDSVSMAVKAPVV